MVPTGYRVSMEIMEQRVEQMDSSMSMTSGNLTWLQMGKMVCLVVVAVVVPVESPTEMSSA